MLRTSGLGARRATVKSSLVEDNVIGHFMLDEGTVARAGLPVEVVTVGDWSYLRDPTINRTIGIPTI